MGLPPFAVKLTNDNFLLSWPGSCHRSTLISLYLIFETPRSQRTRSTPLPSCTCPHIANRGRTLHRAFRRPSHPAALRSLDSSQWYFGGVCVTTMSESRGMLSQTCEASSAPYPNAHIPFAGDNGEPNILNVVRGPDEEARLITAASCFNQRMDGDWFRSS